MRSVPPDTMRDLVGATVDCTVPEPFGTYFFASDAPGAQIARDLERKVFLDAFGNTPAMLEAEYDRYEKSSFFLCVIDHRRRVCAAMMRVIVPLADGPGLKSLNDVEPVWGAPAQALLSASGFDLDPTRTWDIATLAVERDYRTGAALGMMHIGLYQALGRLSRAFDLAWLVAILDYPVYRLIRLQLKRVRIVFTAFADEHGYLGSERSVPTCCPLDFTDEEAGEADPILFDLIYVGTAIKDAVRQIELEAAIEQLHVLVDH